MSNLHRVPKSSIILHRQVPRTFSFLLNLYDKLHDECCFPSTRQVTPVMEKTIPDQHILSPSLYLPSFGKDGHCAVRCWFDFDR